MEIIIITLVIGLIVAGFYLGRTNFAFARMRRFHRKALARAHQAETETRIFRGAFLSIQNPSLGPLSYYATCTGVSEYTVFMRKPLPEPSRPAGDAYVEIPVKTFCDYDDPDFALREALEFAELCQKD